MIASVSKEDLAVATGSMFRNVFYVSTLVAHIIHEVTYLFRTTGQVIGVALSGAVLQAMLLRTLHAKITGPDAEEVSVTPMHLLYIYID